MRFGLNTHLIGTLSILLALATGLTFLVTAAFWLREATFLLAREKERQILGMASEAANPGSGNVPAQPAPAGLIAAAMRGSGAVAGCLAAIGSTPLCSGGDSVDQAALRPLLGAPLGLGQTKRILGGLVWVGFVPASRTLDLAVPLTQSNQAVGVMALRFSLASLLHPEIRRLHRSISLYLAANLLIFLIIGFIRLYRVVVRPITHLVRRADAFTDDSGLPFLALEGGNEMGQLTRSLQRMLTRIRADRDELQRHVVSLEAANRQILAAREEMVRTEKLASVGRLAAGMAHEIGNPVGIVQGYIGLIRQSDLTAREKEEYCVRAEQELQRISRLVRQLLDFARPASGAKSEVDVCQVAEEVVALLRPQPLMDNISLQTRFASESLAIYGDAAHLLQVLLNGLINAADSIRAAGSDQPGLIELVVAPVMTPSGQRVQVDILDTGLGLAEDQIGNVFDPFYTTKEPGQGTGLGLSVSHAIITAMGGTISLANREGGGATLTIVLPAAGQTAVPQDLGAIGPPCQEHPDAR